MASSSRGGGQPPKIKCPKPGCGHMADQAYPYCAKCSTKLEVKCSGCGTPVPNTKNCSSCGAVLQVPTPSTTASNKMTMEARPVGSVGNYDISLQVLEHKPKIAPTGVQGNIHIGLVFNMSRAYGVFDSQGVVISGRCIVLDDLVDNSVNQKALMRRLGWTGKLKPMQVFPTTSEGFLQCVVWFHSPGLEIGFGLVGSEVDVEEKYLSGPSTPVIKGLSAREVRRIVYLFNKRKGIKR